VKNSCIIQQSEQKVINLGTISNYDFDEMFDPPSITKPCIQHKMILLVFIHINNSRLIVSFSHNIKGRVPPQNLSDTTGPNIPLDQFN
jgi:hypothetical protein